MARASASKQAECLDATSDGASRARVTRRGSGALRSDTVNTLHTRKDWSKRPEPRMSMGMSGRLGFLVLATGLLACGGDGSSDSGASSASGGVSGSGGSGAEAGSGGAGGNGATGGTGGIPTSCQDLGGETPDDAVCVLEITGEVVDEAGAPVADRELSLCGPVCFFATSREDGSFSIPVGYDLPLRDYSTLLHGRPFNVSFYYQAPGRRDRPCR